MFAFVDNRTGDVLRYRHDDGAVTMTFTAEDLKTAMRSNATRKAMEQRSSGPRSVGVDLSYDARLGVLN
jgi:hypothetical protein